MGVSAQVAGAAVAAVVTGGAGLAMMPKSRPPEEDASRGMAGGPAGEPRDGRGLGTMAAASVAAPLGLYIASELVKSPVWGRALSGASMGAMAGLMGAMTLAMGKMDMGGMPMSGANTPGHTERGAEQESKEPARSMPGGMTMSGAANGATDRSRIEDRAATDMPHTMAAEMTSADTGSNLATGRRYTPSMERNGHDPSRMERNAHREESAPSRPASLAAHPLSMGQHGAAPHERDGMAAPDAAAAANAAHERMLDMLPTAAPTEANAAHVRLEHAEPPLPKDAGFAAACASIAESLVTPAP